MRSSVRSFASSVNGRYPGVMPAYLSRRTRSFAWRAAGMRGSSVWRTTPKTLRVTSVKAKKYLRLSSLVRRLSCAAVMRISRSCFTLGSASVLSRASSSATAVRASLREGS